MKLRTIVACFLCNCLALHVSNANAEERNHGQNVRALMTDNFSIKIDRRADFVWQQVKNLYIDGERYRQNGGEVVPLVNDPEAYLGGYKTVRRSEDGNVVGESAFRFSRIDEARRFIAMTIDTPENGKAIVTHEVEPAGDGAVYSVVIHVFIDISIEPGEDTTSEVVRKKMAERLSEHHAGVEDIWKKQKDLIESTE